MKFKKNNFFLLAGIILFVGLFFYYILPPIDPDLGWHLRYGQYIFQNHQIMRVNQITFLLPHYYWRQSYSFYQLTLFLIYHWIGFWGIAFAGALVTTAIFWPFIFSKKMINDAPLTVLLMIFFTAPVASLGYRSQLFSLMGCSWLYWYLTRDKPSRGKHLFFFFLAFVFWANLHGGFILGLILLAIAGMESFWQKNLARAKFLSSALLVSFLATLINPFGLGVYREVIRHSWYPLNKLIAEWTPPGKIYVTALIFFFILITVLLSIRLLLKNNASKSTRLQRKHIFFLTFSWLFFAFLSLKARRHLPFFGLASIYWLFFISPLSFPKRWIRWGIVPLSLGLVLIRITNWPKIDRHWHFICQSRVSQPCPAVEFLKEKPHLCHYLYNTYEWGGFLAWQLPRTKTFVDGRMPAWPTPEKKSPYSIYLEILQTRPGFNQRLEKYRADCLLIGRGTFLDLELKKSQKYPWQAVYEDKQAVIYRHK